MGPSTGRAFPCHDIAVLQGRARGLGIVGSQQVIAPQVGKQDLTGRPVRSDVVDAECEQVVVRSDADKKSPEQAVLRQVEVAADEVPGESERCGLRIVNGGHVLLFELECHGVGYVGAGRTAVAHHMGAKDVVVGDDQGQRGLESSSVERTTEPQEASGVVGGQLVGDLVQDPQPLLGVRQEGRRPKRPSDGTQSAALGEEPGEGRSALRIEVADPIDDGRSRIDIGHVAPPSSDSAASSASASSSLIPSSSLSRSRSSSSSASSTVTSIVSTTLASPATVGSLKSWCT